MQTLFTGRNLIKLETTVSTNNYANELLANSEPSEGTAIMAEYQQHGKGQRGSSWISEFGANLLVSFLYYPGFLKAEEQFFLTAFASIAVAETIEYSGAEKVTVKWPNDIFTGDSKVAGILIENFIRGDKILSSIIGIGININQEDFPAFPVKATSILRATGNTFNKYEIYEVLSNKLEKYYLDLKKGNNEAIIKKYQNKLFRKNEIHNYETNGKVFAGKISGVDDQGLLKIQSDKNEQLKFDFKEIKFII